MEHGKKTHKGECAWAFVKYTKGKCSICGYRKQARYACAFPDCGKWKLVNHFCTGK